MVCGVDGIPCMFDSGSGLFILVRGEDGVLKMYFLGVPSWIVDCDGNYPVGFARVDDFFKKLDINGDGVRDLGDLILALKVLSGDATQDVKKEADVNGDGRIGLAETTALLNHLAQKMRGSIKCSPKGNI